MSSNEIKNIFFKKYYKKIAFFKESSYYSMKHLKKKVLLLLLNKIMEIVPDPCNAKEQYISFMRKKNRK